MSDFERSVKFAATLNDRHRGGGHPPTPATPPCVRVCTWPTMPSADFCPAVRPPFGNLSRSRDAKQISWGKRNRLPCTAAGSTLRIFDGYGLRGKLPARPTLTPCIRFLSIDSHICYTLLSDPASRR